MLSSTQSYYWKVAYAEKTKKLACTQNEFRKIHFWRSIDNTFHFHHDTIIHLEKNTKHIGNSGITMLIISSLWLYEQKKYLCKLSSYLLSPRNEWKWMKEKIVQFICVRIHYFALFLSHFKCFGFFGSAL